jgi:hypothetical protein
VMVPDNLADVIGNAVSVQGERKARVMSDLCSGNL